MTAESALKADGFRSRLGDAINPIAIKELRQAVQSRFVTATLMILLCIQLVALGLYLLFSGEATTSFDAGRQIFTILLGIVFAAGMLFVPLYTAIRLVAERSDTQVDLLFITTIKPRRIITGKLAAATAINILIFSACLPFMTLTYFLRGIDLPSIFVLMAFCFLVIIACAQLAIFVACIPVSRIFKTVLGLICLIIFFIIYVAMMSSIGTMLIFGVGSRFDNWDFWEVALTLMLIIGAFCGLLFVLSVAMISPHAANRALPVRLYVTMVWLLAGVAASVWSGLIANYLPVDIWMVLSSLVFSLALFVAVSERDTLGRRVKRAIPVSGWKRFFTFFFFSGSANGLAWASVMMGLTMGWVGAWRKILGWMSGVDSLGDNATWMSGIALYFFCYAASGTMLRRRAFGGIGSEWNWLFGGILMAIGGIVPFLVGTLLFLDDRWQNQDYGYWLVGNPFAWEAKEFRLLYAAVGIGWTVILVMLGRRWFVERVRSFRPLDSEKQSLNDE
ncbi:MAG: hypothetical protein ACREBD_21960 [Blastocatellia bacterium]